MEISSDKSTIDSPLKFGRYVVVRELGKGAMGQVYLADDPVLDRKIALKVIALDANLDKSTRDDYFARFSYEAKASAKLNHPSIVSVFDAGEENGVPWIAFQFVEGETLENLLERRGTLPIKRAVAFALDIASALQHAHAWSIIHRDVKPANILIESSTGIAKLADFGIVKAPWESSTQEGSALGSPGYMSPEQIEGTDLDPRTDLFSLGVVMYQMISGKNPFIRDTFTATVMATCKGDFTSLRDIDETIPPALDFAVRKCLSSDRKHRFNTAAELINILKTVDQPSSKEPVSIKATSPSTGTKSKTRVEAGFAETRPFPDVKVQRSSFFGLFKNVPWLINAKQVLIRFVSLIYSKVSEFIERSFTAASSKLLKSGQLNKRAALSWIDKFLPSSLKNLNRKTISKALFGISLAGIVLFIGILIAVVFSRDPSLPRPGTAEYQLMRQCSQALKSNNRDGALVAVDKISDLREVHAATEILAARILIRDGQYEVAASHVDQARALKGGKRTIKRELPRLLDEIRRQFKKASAPAELIDLASVSLQAAKSPIIHTWLADTSYWLHWNAAKVLSSAGMQADLVPLCVMDLSAQRSEDVQLKAIYQLGEIGDKRAIPILRKIKQSPISRPEVSLEAEKVLKEKFQ